MTLEQIRVLGYARVTEAKHAPGFAALPGRADNQRSRKVILPSAPLLLSQAFNGLALGTLLALVSSGLTIILGTLGVLNFAHGALFMVGAYAIFVIRRLHRLVRRSG